MTSFSQELLAKKLSELNRSQESVETLSLWMLHHRKHAKAIVQCWAEKFPTISETRKLAFIFLANDVMKNHKNKCLEYRSEFGNVLPDALRNVGETCTSTQMFYQIHRVLDIWRKRRILSKDILDDCCESINAPIGSKKSQEKLPKKTEEIKKVRITLNNPTPEELMQAISLLENAPSSDEATRIKISALPSKFFEIQNLKGLRENENFDSFKEKLENALAMVEDYNDRLQEELRQRENLNEMLISFKEAEKERLMEVEHKIKKVEKDLVETIKLREELERHKESLPDLEHYRCVEELPPLPSVEDLFKRQF